MCVDLEVLPSETNVAKNIGGNSEIIMRGRSQLHVYHACYFAHLVLSLLLWLSSLLHYAKSLRVSFKLHHLSRLNLSFLFRQTVSEQR